MAVKKIPTYQSNKQVGATFTPPKLKDATVPLLNSIHKLGQDHLDKVAAEQGETQGFQDLQSNTVNIQQAEAKPNTIRGQAYKVGARSAFVAKTKNDYENQLNEAYQQNIYDLDAFNKEAQKIRNNVLSNTPENLHSLIVVDYDNASAKLNRQIGNNAFTRQVEEDVKIQTDRITNLSNKLTEAIKLDDGSAEDIVAEQMALLSSLYNDQKVIDVNTLGTYTDGIFNQLLSTEIMGAYEATPDADKQAFIQNIANGGYKDFIQATQDTYGDEIKTALPQFAVPSTISDAQLSVITSDLEAMFKETTAKLKTEKSIYKTSISDRLTQALDDNVPVYEAVPLASIIAGANQLMMDEEEIEALTYAYQEAVGVQALTKNIDKMSYGELNDKLSLIEFGLEAGATLTDTDSQIKMSINNKAKDLVQAQIEHLESIVGDKNIHSLLDQDNIFDLEKISSMDDIKLRRTNTANKLGIDRIETIPLVDANEVAGLKAGLAAQDINQVNSTIELIKQLELDNNISIMTELELPIELEIAMELGNDTERMMLLEAFMKKDQIATSIESRKKGVDKLDFDVAQNLADDQDFVDMHFNKGPVEYSKTLQFYETIINYQLVQGLDYDNAKKKADELYDRAFKPQVLDNGQTISIPNSQSIDATTTTDTVIEINDIYANPVLYNYACPDGITLSECESAFFNDVKVEREGTQIIFKNKSVDADLGTAGGTIPILHKTKNGTIAIAPLVIELDKNKKSQIEPSTDIEGAFALEVNTKIDGYDQIATTTKDTQKVADFGYIMNNIEADETMDATLNYYNKLAVDNNFIDQGVRNVTTYDPEYTNIVAGILLKNVQQGQKFTEWELNFLSQFDDYALLGNEEIQQTFQSKWNDMVKKGGYAGKGTGARLDLGTSMFVLLQSMERE